MKTTIYIDGYNLYYGVLRNTDYKWLDIVKLFTDIVKSQNPKSEIIAVKFFTAPVKIKLSHHKEDSQKSQRDYHRALEKIYTSFQLVEGYFSLSEGWYPRYKTPIDRDDIVKTWKLEEKQTDVNIALHLYRDAAKNKTDQVILVSNDSDLIPALQAVKEDFSHVKIGAVMPILKNKKGRPPSGGLSKIADWTRSNIDTKDLEKFQLPEIIHTGKKPILKPKYW